MSCSKQFTIPSGCQLLTCEIKTPYPLPTDLINFGVGTVQLGAYSPDYCYFLQLTNTPDFTITHFNKYDPATNSLVVKASIAGTVDSGVAYDSANKKFVCSNGTDVLIFDPVTETISDTFACNGVATTLLYIASKQKVYGQSVGGIGVIDVAARTSTVLGVVAHHLSNLTYASLNDSLYGTWITGAGGNLVKFSLVTNLSTNFLTVTGISVQWIPDTSLILIFDANNWYEWEPLTDTQVGGGISTEDFRWTMFYSTADQLVYGIGYSATTTDGAIMSFDPVTHVAENLFDDYWYKGAYEINGSSVFAIGQDIVSSVNLVRRMCLN